MAKRESQARGQDPMLHDLTPWELLEAWKRQQADLAGRRDFPESALGPRTETCREPRYCVWYQVDSDRLRIGGRDFVSRERAADFLRTKVADGSFLFSATVYVGDLDAPRQSTPP